MKLKRPTASTGHGTGVLQARSLRVRLAWLKVTRRLRLGAPDPEEQLRSRRPARRARAGRRHRIRLGEAAIRNLDFSRSVPW